MRAAVCILAVWLLYLDVRGLRAATLFRVTSAAGTLLVVLLGVELLSHTLEFLAYLRFVRYFFFLKE